MDKLYYIEIFKFACLEMQNKEISAKKIFENTISEFNESEFKGQKEIIKDKSTLTFIKHNNERIITDNIAGFNIISNTCIPTYFLFL